jgi:micrococcal nuclease
MRRKDLIIVLLAAFIGLSFTQESYRRVGNVLDGDTIQLENGEKVRYLGINAPEIGHGEGEETECMALESKSLNASLVGKKRVKLQCDQVKEDRYGRLLAYVFLENGSMVNAVLVRKGLAHVRAEKPNLKYFTLLLQEQRLAMDEEIGIWSRCFSEPEAFYPGNANSLTFHRPHCPYVKRIHSKNIVKFESRRKAFWDGFSPCRQCRP